MELKDLFGLVSDAIGIGTFSVSLGIWYLVKRQQKIIKNSLLENFQKCSTEGEEIETRFPIALTISLLPEVGDINPLVKEYLVTSKLEMRLDDGIQFRGLNNKDEIKNFKGKLIDKKLQFTKEGITEVHLFVAGPIFAGILVGATFDNWIPVKVYHKTKNSYEYQYLLQ